MFKNERQRQKETLPKYIFKWKIYTRKKEHTGIGGFDIRQVTAFVTIETETIMFQSW